jgi:hypothetical protein
MEIRNNPSFCGKIAYDSFPQRAKYLLTKKVRDTMRAARTGTVLRYEELKPPYTGKVEFASPIGRDSFAVRGVYKRKSRLTEKNVLDVIKEDRGKR